MWKRVKGNQEEAQRKENGNSHYIIITVMLAVSLSV